MFGLVLESVILRSGAKLSLFLHYVITFLYCNGVRRTPAFHGTEFGKVGVF
jgi:hypothetical protein